MLNYKTHPNFAIIVPSRRFDGTNALARMPIDLMKTHYDEDSYKIHMNTAKEHTLNVAMVFVKRIMLDIDNTEDLKFALEQNEKPEIREKIKRIVESN
jgi:2-phospho-L-lactate guanylyltransferase